MNRPERDFENLLRSHLSSELDAMRGQAARAFAREVTRPMQRQLRRNVWSQHAARFRSKVQHWGTIGLAMAACTALGVVLPRFMGTNDPAPLSTNTDSKIVTPSYAGYERTTELQHVDEGNVQLPDGAPARKLRQQRVDSLRYIDPATKEEYEYIIPSERYLVIPSDRQ